MTTQRNDLEEDMASSLLVLLDDIATVLDDVALMTKVAAKKTTGLLGDDLALNAEQVSGVRAEREIPVVWAVFKGSVVNKLILVPAALAISAVAPWLVTYLLMIGGLFLSYEGVEKIWHSLAHKKDQHKHQQALKNALENPKTDLAKFERDKVKGAIRTDFVLSAEIIVIALGTVTNATFMQQVFVVSVIALAMTVGVYGVVACIVKLDDLGLWLQKEARQQQQPFKYKLGSGILALCPWLMKGLSILGTAAMFLVGGGILVHGLPFLHHFIEHLHLPLPGLTAILFNAIVGIIAGIVVMLVVSMGQKLFVRNTAH